ncbi:MAG: hypothetical protein Kow0089_20980 [Desulfobulbaceae bacterium]
MARGRPGAKRTRLSAKILLGVGGTVLLFTLAAALLFLSTFAAPEPGGAGKTSFSRAELSAALAKARLAAEAYHSRPDPALSATHAEAVKTLTVYGKDLSAVTRLDQAFHELATERDKKGSPGTGGLLAELNKAGDELVQTAAASETGDLALACLRLVNTQETYLASDAPADLRNLRQALLRFTSLLNDIHIDPVEAQVLRKSSREYASSLDRYLAVSLATSDPGLSASLGKEMERQAETMRTILETMGGIIDRVSVPGVLAMVNEARKNEALYLLTGDEHIAGKVTALADHLLRAYTDSSILQEQREHGIAAVSKYRDLFSALVRQNGVIEERRAKYDATAAELEKQIMALPAAGSSRAGSPSVEQNSLAMAGAVLALAALLVGLFVAVTLSRSVSAPLGAMTDTIRKVVTEQDFNVEVPAGTTHETALLASELNTLLRLTGSSLLRKKEQSPELKKNIADLASLAQTLREKLAGIHHSLSELAASGGARRTQLETVRESVRLHEQKLAAFQSRLGERPDADMIQGGTKTDVRELFERILGGVEHLSALSSRLGDLTSLSKEIAEQTDLLALNASVKAARAGAYGREFTSVADELAMIARRAEEMAREARLISGELGEKIEEAVVKPARKAESVVAGFKETEDRGGASQEDVADAAGELTAGLGELENLVAHLTDTVSQLDTSLTMHITACEELQFASEDLENRLAALSGEDVDNDDTDEMLRQAVNDITRGMDEEREDSETGADDPEKDSSVANTADSSSSDEGENEQQVPEKG